MADLFGSVLDLSYYSARLLESLSHIFNYKPLSETEHSELRSTRRMSTMYVDQLVSGDKAVKLKVGYTFYNRKRINTLIIGKKYSSTNQFATIYRKLTQLNNGVSFLDVYFDVIFPVFFKDEIKSLTERVYKTLRDEYETLFKAQRLTKRGVPDKRYRVYRQLQEFESFRNVTMQQHFDKLSIKIKKHIQACLMTGIIPLSFRLKPKTVKRKSRLGLSTEPFFATGQLVDNLIISYTIEEDA